MTRRAGRCSGWTERASTPYGHPDGIPWAMYSNGNSFGNGASICLGGHDELRIRTMAWIFRRQVPKIR